MSIEITSEIKDLPISSRKIKESALKHLKKCKAKGNSFELLIVGKKRMKELNLKYMRKDSPTDVLSFPLNPIPGEKEKFIGTIFLGSDIILSSAKKQGKVFRDEFVFILNHGIDHLLGIHHAE